MGRMRRVLPIILVAAVLIALVALGLARLRPGGMPDPPRPAATVDVDPLAGELLEGLIAETARAPRDAARRARLARAYQANGLPGLAARTYEQALARDGKRAEWWYLLAACRRQIGDADGALAALRTAEQLAPQNATVLHRLGEWLLERGAMSDAAAALDRALRVAPGDPSLRVTLARIQLNADRPADALATLAAIGPVDDSAGYVTQLEGMALHRLGRVVEARRKLAGARAPAPSWPDPWLDALGELRRGTRAVLERADELARTGRAEEAVSSLLELHNRRPRDVTVLAKLGETCLEAGRLADAERYLAQAVAVDPEYAPTQLHLSRLHRERGDTRLALRHANRAVRLQPSFGPAHRAIARALLRQTPPAWADAEPALEAAIRYGAADPDTRINLALARFELGRVDEAHATIERVLDGNPYNLRALMVATVIHMERGDLDAAERVARRAESLAPEDPQVRRGLAEIARRQREQP